jgi:hypothetical protein
MNDVYVMDIETHDPHLKDLGVGQLERNIMYWS